MKSRMVGAFAVVMIALMVAGLAYATWTETLYISGTVETGDLDAHMVAGDSWDSEPGLKDYSDIYCYVEETDPYTLIVVVENAYPCIDYYQEFGIENTGTIPLNITSISAPTGNFTGVGTVEVGTFVDDEWTPVELPIQVEPGDTALLTLHVHLTNNANELSTYVFEITVTVAQWNLAPE